MSLLVTYLGLAVVGIGGIYMAGLAIEHIWPVASLPAFLGMFFVMLWLAWLVAVRITAPRGEPAA
jgi:hypothetical protein